jgi:hypothetical protein
MPPHTHKTTPWVPQIHHTYTQTTQCCAHVLRTAGPSQHHVSRCACQHSMHHAQCPTGYPKRMPSGPPNTQLFPVGAAPAGLCCWPYDCLTTKRCAHPCLHRHAMSLHAGRTARVSCGLRQAHALQVQQHAVGSSMCAGSIHALPAV